MSILLAGSSSRAVNAVVILIGALVVTEGAALAANWHGSADEFAERLQSGGRSLLAFFSPLLVRTVLGLGVAVLGAIVFWGGVRYL